MHVMYSIDANAKYLEGKKGALRWGGGGGGGGGGTAPTVIDLGG